MVRDYIDAHWVLGAAHRLTPDLSASDHHLNEALRRCRAINSVDSEADILLDLARLRRDQGNLSEACRLAEDARAIATRSGYVLQGADSHLFLAELAQAAGNRPRRRLWLRRRCSWPSVMAESLFIGLPMTRRLR